MPRRLKKIPQLTLPNWSFGQGLYMVTAGTYGKLPHLNTPERRDFFLETLLVLAADFGWQLHAWSVMPNHYHFIAASPEDPKTLRKFLAKLQMVTAKQLNEWDGAPGRKVWHHFWGSHITFERSYLPRLNYIHQNTVQHGAAENASEYRWCSAKWFAENAPAALVATVGSLGMDNLEVEDDF